MARKAHRLSEPDSQSDTSSIHVCVSRNVRVAVPKLGSIARSPSLLNESVCMEIDMDLRRAK